MIRHVPVMARRISGLLAEGVTGTVIDCTLGDGGHSEALLADLPPQARVVGLDRDADALREASARLSKDARFSCVHTAFSKLAAVEATAGAAGFLFDFGVSSRQIDEDARGFTIRPGVALDLRMDRCEAFDLRAVLTESDSDELGRRLSELADVPRSRTVARHLAGIAATRGLLSDDLEAALLSAFPRGMRDRPRELARLAMALRMLVNRELEEIQEALPAAWDRMAPGGRLAVLTYHSVEDRLVKGLLRGLIGDDPDAPRDLYGNRPDRKGDWVVRLEKPSTDEIAANSRARSAQLRVVEKRRGVALAGILVAMVMVGLVGSVMVGCVWRQTRHVELEKGLDAARADGRRLDDSLVQMEAAVRAERQPSGVAARAALYGYRTPQRQFRLPEPDTSLAEVGP
ncbi:MAG TPA: 16S rRNA (cytosine(1402)-N(4))-methyltransferase RsmH [Fibrobacteria bacterium]|nr:16S rRNA (cytosine(1402)-N(4))-methyltransferase RsmH [Fibrobacteria bacterium]